MADAAIKADGIAQAIGVVREISTDRSRTLLQQSVNRAGSASAAKLAREVRQALPVKLRIIRARIKFRNGDKAGNAARIRAYGAGKGQSAEVRPRHAKPKYATTPPSARRMGTRTGKQRNAVRSMNAVSWGVGGYMPRQTSVRGFVLAVGKGRRFVPPWAAEFAAMRNQAQVFERRGRTRQKIDIVRGVTVGRIVTETGLTNWVEQEWQRAAIAEYTRRLEVEMTRQAKR